ncbi:hypothetical protein DICSQDRAFT_177034 [Dichomitus squalens LYAD-421 SS1]|uniref:C2H2-type domain-containing protein n=1 Tax=Dichomitus squalens TaxID=114155 RepID=A0A4Q9PUY7_9APHY|nr:uncharacterized protein DICSQDRAFT_177034 [Dichomitus squalens LYAD-421 SS1]EJF67418.1 hypothetical protein DICSQDRAFT_177034 [Dichomitus squalens LYAD-421 SS1]TBU58174.1 hypothetical protein BD310DRAFT_1039388 [Dichomitus squalens]
MVRSQAKQTPDEKKETKKKTSSAAASNGKKKADTGSWPCKMDGCKKVFAREADLKRHQRTTKTHSIPGLYVLSEALVMLAPALNPVRGNSSQCPQCDATFTRTDALRRHQKSRHNGVIIEPAEPEKDKQSGEGASSGSRSPSPTGSPARSQGEGSINGSPPAGQSSSAGGSSGRASSYYRPHTMQDGYYAAYGPPRPPPGMVMDPHYPPPPMGLPTSATRGSWQPTPAPPPWPGPDGQPMAPPPPGMYIPTSYYPSPYYRHPGVPLPQHIPQINPELLAQSNGHSNGIGPPESSLRNTSADTPTSRTDGKDKDARAGSGSASTSAPSSAAPADDSRMNTPQAQASTDAGTDDGPDASTLMAAAALQAVLAFQKEQEAREAQAQAANMRATSTASPPAQPPPAPEASPPSQTVRVDQPPDARPSVVPVQAAAEIDPNLDTVGDPDPDVPADGIVASERGETSEHLEQFVSEDGTPMLNPGEPDLKRVLPQLLQS